MNHGQFLDRFFESCCDGAHDWFICYRHWNRSLSFSEVVWFGRSLVSSRSLRPVSRTRLFFPRCQPFSIWNLPALVSGFRSKTGSEARVTVPRQPGLLRRHGTSFWSSNVADLTARRRGRGAAGFFESCCDVVSWIGFHLITKHLAPSFRV